MLCLIEWLQLSGVAAFDVYVNNPVGASGMVCTNIANIWMCNPNQIDSCCVRCVHVDSLVQATYTITSLTGFGTSNVTVNQALNQGKWQKIGVLVSLFLSQICFCLLACQGYPVVYCTVVWDRVSTDPLW